MLFICTVCLCWVELLIFSCIIMSFNRTIKSQSISLSVCRNIFSHKRLNSSFKEDLEHSFPFFNVRWFCRLLFNSQLLVQVSKREWLLSLNYHPSIIYISFISGIIEDFLHQHCTEGPDLCVHGGKTVL